MRATGPATTRQELAEGRQYDLVACDGDISVNINFDPVNGGGIDGSLNGSNLRTVAFRVISVTALSDRSTSSLSEVTLEILNANDVCEGQLELLTDAPGPTSSSEAVRCATVGGPFLVWGSNWPSRTSIAMASMTLS